MFLQFHFHSIVLALPEQLLCENKYLKPTGSSPLSHSSFYICILNLKYGNKIKSFRKQRLSEIQARGTLLLLSYVEGNILKMDTAGACQNENKIKVFIKKKKKKVLQSLPLLISNECIVQPCIWDFWFEKSWKQNNFTCFIVQKRRVNNRKVSKEQEAKHHLTFWWLIFFFFLIPWNLLIFLSSYNRNIPWWSYYIWCNIM